jgi:hypothetical protein
VGKKDEKESKVVVLARKAIEEYIINGKQIQPPEDLPQELKGKRGTFVSLKKNGRLRGCIGTTKATQANIALEIIMNAINACSHDLRFESVKSNELDDLEISVDILGKPEPVSSIEELDPEKYGVIVEKDHRTGLLLPDLEGIDSVEKQVEIARKKAGIVSREGLKLYRFEVQRFE